MATSKQADIQHASCNAVPLVWGSLRLAPTTKERKCFNNTIIGKPVTLSVKIKHFAYFIKNEIITSEFQQSVHLLLITMIHTFIF